MGFYAAQNIFDMILGESTTVVGGLWVGGVGVFHPGGWF